MREIDYYEKGYDDFDDGVEIDECPYPVLSEKREEWEEGWQDAQARRL